jgi:hypothetical protein
MIRVCRLLAFSVVVVALSACGGSPRVPGLDEAQQHTVASGTARFTITITADLSGSPIQSSETGTVSFVQRRAHLYKLVPGGGLPQELILRGPYTYTNANVGAAMNDSSVKPWTKLDTRRLSAAQRDQPDELAHVRALAYLSDGAGRPTRIGDGTLDSVHVTHFRAELDPRRLDSRAPRSIRAAVGSDYLATPFPADFWLDDQGRVRRVLVGYRTRGGTRITVDGGFSDFGTAIDLTLPAPGRIQDITP